MIEKNTNIVSTNTMSINKYEIIFIPYHNFQKKSNNLRAALSIKYEHINILYKHICKKNIQLKFNTLNLTYML